MFNSFIAITLIYKTYISQSIADYGNVCRAKYWGFYCSLILH